MANWWHATFNFVRVPSRTHRHLFNIFLSHRALGPILLFLKLMTNFILSQNPLTDFEVFQEVVIHGCRKQGKEK